MGGDSSTMEKIGVALAVYSASESHKAATSQKHGTKRAKVAAAESKTAAEVETKESVAAAKRDKLNRAQSIDANKTTFTNPLGVGGQAQAIKKSLTGQ